RHLHLVDDDREHRAAEDLGSGEQPISPTAAAVTHRGSPRLRHASDETGSGSATSTGNRSAALYSKAAAMRPVTSGCGRVGRLLSSGWAWVATKYGCRSRRSSTNSMRRPSGEVPLITRPAPVRTSRYALLTSYRCRCRSVTVVLRYTSAAMLPSTRCAG